MNIELINALTLLGVSEKEAKVVVLIIEKKIVTTRECEQICGLRQPEVSVTLKKLRERGWVQEGSALYSGGRGRNEKTYVLKMPIGQITKSLLQRYELDQVKSREKIKYVQEK
jgi:predicted transcriptional regulator